MNFMIGYTVSNVKHLTTIKQSPGIALHTSLAMPVSYDRNLIIY